MTALPPRPTHNFNPLRFSPPVTVSEEERRRMIAEAAYGLAEQRGFAPGREEQDWLDAETAVNRKLGRQPEYTRVW